VLCSLSLAALIRLQKQVYLWYYHQVSKFVVYVPNQNHKMIRYIYFELPCMTLPNHVCCSYSRITLLCCRKARSLRSTVQTRGSCWHRVLPHIKLFFAVRSGRVLKRMLGILLTCRHVCLCLDQSSCIHATQGQNTKQNKHGKLELIFYVRFSFLSTMRSEGAPCTYAQHTLSHQHHFLVSVNW